MVANVARFLAPIALAAVAVGTYVIVDNGLAAHHPTVVHGTADTTGGHKLGNRPVRALLRAKFYVVRAGDTLSAISVKTHVSLQRLLSLNPSVSANSLQTGQRLRLRR
jgi:LysM repeat protein